MNYYSNLERRVAALERRWRALKWLLVAIGVVRVALYVEGWALGLTQAQMVAQVLEMLRP